MRSTHPLAPRILAAASARLSVQGYRYPRTYRSADPRPTALQAITAAADSFAPGEAEPLEAALDLVCAEVFGRRCGVIKGTTVASVSTWERRLARESRHPGAVIVATLERLYRDPGPALRRLQGTTTQ